MKKIIKRCAVVVIALAVITVVVVRIVILNSEGEKIRSRYGFDSVEIIDDRRDKRIEVNLRLKEEDLKKYYDTIEGEQYMDKVIPEVIYEINYNADLRDYIMGLVEWDKFSKFDIAILMTEWDDPRSSAAESDVGQYTSDIYSAEEWFTEENRKIQKWTRYTGSSWFFDEGGTSVTLPEIEKRIEK